MTTTTTTSNAADVTSQPNSSVFMTSDIVSAMWVEVAVFLATLILALFMRRFSGPQGVKKGKAKHLDFDDYAGPPCVANHERRSAQQINAGPRGDARRIPENAGPIAGKSTAQTGPRRNLGTPGGRRVADLAENLPRTVDLVCDAGSARDSRQEREAGSVQQPTFNRNSVTPTIALELFEELKTNGGCEKLKGISKTPGGNDALGFYTGVVQCAIRVGKPELVSDVIETMRKTAVPRSRIFYESAMKHLAGRKFHREALEMFSQMQQDGIEPSSVTLSCLISFAVEVDEMGKAVEFFERLEQGDKAPSIRAYMTILRVHAKRMDVETSVRIIRGMEATKGVKPDNLILNIVLSTCVNAGRAEEAAALLEEFVDKDPPIVDVISYNTVVKGYAQAGEFAKAIAILERMARQIPPVKPNAITFNTIMDAAVRAKRANEAWKVLTEMRRQGLVPDKYTCSILVKGLNGGEGTPPSREQVTQSLSLIGQLGVPDGPNKQLHETLFGCLLDACAHLQDWELLLNVFDQMKAQQVCPAGNTFGNIMKLMGKVGEMDRLVAVWDEMLARKIEPSVINLGILLEACVCKGEIDRGVAAFDRLPESGFAKTDTLTNALVRFLCKAKQPERALMRYSALKQKVAAIAASAPPPGLKAASVSSSSSIESSTCVVLIRALSEAGNLEAAASVINDMHQAGLTPEEGVYNGLLVCCAKGNGATDADVAQKAFKHMVANGVKPTGATFSLMIKILGRAKRLDDAFEIMATMRSEHKLVPSMLTYTCLMQACVRNKQTGKALELLAQMRKTSPDMALDQVAYGTLINGCAFANFITQGTDLLEEATKNKVEVQGDAVSNLLSAALRKRGKSEAQVNRRLADLIEKFNIPVMHRLKERIASLKDDAADCGGDQ